MTIETKKQITVEMGIPVKLCIPSYGDMDVAIPRDRNGDYEPQLIKKYQNTVTLQGAMPLSQLFEVLFDSSVVVKYPIF